MRTVCINGLTFSRENKTGIERYVYHIVKLLDSMVPEDMRVVLLCPINKPVYIPELNNIEVDKIPMSGFITRMFSIFRYLKKHKALYVDMSGDFCFTKNSIGCIHDIRVMLHKDYDPLIWRLRGIACFYSYKLLAKKIVTVSNTSKNEISSRLKINQDRIKVVYSGWEYLKDVSEDDTIFERYPLLERNKYYYTVGSMLPHKNMEWIFQCANCNPDKTFVIAGKNIRNKKIKVAKNMYYVGYVSDSENKSLMTNCEAFIYPSKYEGFGLPPLEALSCGADLILSDIPVFRELYSGCATFFDPDEYNLILKKRCHPDSKEKERLLQKYTLLNAASAWMEIIDELMRG